MPSYPASLNYMLLATFTFFGCADDASNQSDAGDRPADAAADSGKKDAATSDSSDAGRPSEASNDAGDSGPADAAQAASQQTVKLRFHAQLGDEPFACGRTYNDQGSSKQSVALRDFRMYVQDVALVDTDGHEVPVKLDARDPWQSAEVALLDFEDGSGECFGTAETNREITGVVPKGDYRALRFSHGVPEQLNHSDPKTVPAPLQVTGMSWNWLLGFRFVRLEIGTVSSAELDTDAGADPGSYSLHVGSTGCAGNQNEGTIKCAKPNRSRIELAGFELGKSEIVLDVRPLLKGNDLAQIVECHSGTELCAPLFQALGVSYGTGQPGSEQSVFRLE
jgi:uncharacterized repeat protein (TIGR04052 family)